MNSKVKTRAFTGRGEMERKVIHTENDKEVSLIDFGHKLNEERRE